MVVSVIDIDQTISTGFIGKSLEESISYYQAIGIVLPETISCYLDLFQLPEVIALHEALPGAVKGVNHLGTYGPIWYYTVRKHDDREQEHRLQDATKQWLLQKRFPSPSQVVFCQSILNKLVKLYEQEKQTQNRLLLIDDRWSKAVEAFELLDAHSPQTVQMATALRERLTLVAFGVEIVPQSTGLHIIALPSWEQMEMVFKDLIG